MSKKYLLAILGLSVFGAPELAKANSCVNSCEQALSDASKKITKLQHGDVVVHDFVTTRNVRTYTCDTFCYAIKNHTL